MTVHGQTEEERAVELVELQIFSKPQMFLQAVRTVHNLEAKLYGVNKFGLNRLVQPSNRP